MQQAREKTYQSIIEGNEALESKKVETKQLKAESRRVTRERLFME